MPTENELVRSATDTGPDADVLPRHAGLCDSEDD